MRLLITGASGMLGGRLCALLATRHQVTAAVHAAAPPDGLPGIALDLASEASIAQVVRDARPDAVIHSAALADADRCERDPEAAALLNSRASERLAAVCVERGARLVALSTDLLLAGDRPLSDESVAPRPTLVYARTKRDAEEAVLRASPGFAVARVALVVGRGFSPRGTASEAALWGLREGRRLRLFTDQHRTPSDPESVADAIERLLAREACGLYQLGGAERVSRFEIGVRTARAFGLDESAIEPSTQQDAPGAPRPADCSMDIAKARRDLGWEPRPLDLAIRESRPGRG